MENLFREIEMPLTRVLHEMEKEGVEVRPEELKAYGDALVDRINELENSIHSRRVEVRFRLKDEEMINELKDVLAKTATAQSE